MIDKTLPSHEEQVALVNEAKERMIGRSRFWLEDNKVKAALDRAESIDMDLRKAS